MSTDEERYPRIMIQGATWSRELSPDLSRKIWEEAALQGTTPELLVHQVLWEKLRELGHDPDPTPEDLPATDQNADRVQNLQGDTRA